MIEIDLGDLSRTLVHAPRNPRVVISGNFATPYVVLDALDALIPEYRLHMLNAHGDIPNREGVSYETSFVGPAMRGIDELHYLRSEEHTSELQSH